MKKIAFLGDSIRMGYAARTMELLGDGYEYFQPTDNCRFATYTKRLVWDHRAKLEGSEVIHWNNGLWDICNLWGDGCFTPLDEYIREMEGLARRLLPMTKTLIFATTTPVDPRNPYDKNDAIEAYNTAIVPRLSALGVVINDLHSVIAEDIPAFIKEDRIHLTEAGVEAAARHNADFIRKFL